MWEQIPNPEGFNGISIRRDKFIVASKIGELGGLVWSLLQSDADGRVSAVPGSGVWVQMRIGAPVTADDVQQAANWADHQLLSHGISS